MCLCVCALGMYCFCKILFRQTEVTNPRHCFWGLAKSRCSILRVWHFSAFLFHFLYHSTAMLTFLMKTASGELRAPWSSHGHHHLFPLPCLESISFFLPDQNTFAAFPPSAVSRLRATGCFGNCLWKRRSNPCAWWAFQGRAHGAKSRIPSFGHVNISETSWPGHSQSLRIMDRLGELVLVSEKQTSAQTMGQFFLLWVCFYTEIMVCGLSFIFLSFYSAVGRSGPRLEYKKAINFPKDCSSVVQAGNLIFKGFITGIDCLQAPLKISAPSCHLYHKKGTTEKIVTVLCRCGNNETGHYPS